MQFVEEVQSYERLKRGQFTEFENLQGLGQVLIGLRIARGMTACTPANFACACACG
jgi:hypothetical protein